MPKKFIIPTLIGGIIASAIGFAAPASAESAMDGVTYWELDELAVLSQEIATTKNAVCNGDWQCEDYINRAYSAVLGDKASAVEAYSWRDFLITAFSPNSHTMRVNYFADHADDFSGPLSRLRIFWYPDHEPIYSIFPSMLDEDAYAHIIFDTLQDADTAEKLKSGKEIELSIEDDFFTTGSHTIYYMLEYDNSHSYGMRYFSDCLSVEDGKEFRALMDNQVNLKYLPLNILTTPQEDEPRNEKTGNEEVVDESINTTQSTTSVEPVIKYVYRTVANVVSDSKDTEAILSDNGENIEDTSEIPLEQGNIAPLSESDEVFYPTAGDAVDAYNASQSEAEFPWWILIIAALGIGITAWWFAPKASKKH